MRTLFSIAAFVIGLSVASPASVGSAGVFRTEQSPVSKVRLQGVEDRALRHLLLPGGGAGAKMAARMAERGGHGRISRLLTHELRGRQPLILYASGPHSVKPTRSKGKSAKALGRHRSL